MTNEKTIETKAKSIPLTHHIHHHLRSSLGTSIRGTFAGLHLFYELKQQSISKQSTHIKPI